MLDAVERDSPDKILHLGDYTRDAEDLSAVFPDIPLISVRGNCDGWINVPPEQLITLNGCRILMGHGHTWHVKSGMETGLFEARKSGADILLYGHTHIAACYRQDDLWVMNPGSVLGGRNKPSYGVILLEDTGISCELRHF
jgi:putative phosphoesterase